MRTEEKLLSNRKTALLKLISFGHATCIVSVICVYNYNLVSFQGLKYLFFNTAQ